MGEPVKIADLARTMINLSGFNVYDEKTKSGDIQIVYTGLQPGEKLYEELLVDNSVKATEHPLIHRGSQSFLNMEILIRYLNQLKSAADAFDEGTMRTILSKLCVDDVSRLTGAEITDPKAIELVPLRLHKT